MTDLMEPINLMKPAKGRPPMTDRIASITAQLEYGFTPDQVAADLRIQPASVARWLERHGRADLARVFLAGRPAHRRQGRTCAVCGAACSDDARNCRGCLAHLSNAGRKQAAA
jgi:coenzyme F420-reducing hydrogenase gamma subunit